MQSKCRVTWRRQALYRICVSRNWSCKHCVNSAKQVPHCLAINYFPPIVSLKAVAVLVAFSICYAACGVRNTNSGIQNEPPILGEVMKSHLIAVCFTLMVVPGPVVGTGVAQTKSAKEPPKSVLVTGCLVKGDEPGEVWLAQKNGRIYGLEGKIDLNAHLGQKVVVEGYVLPEGMEEAAEEAQKENKAGKRETTDLRVSMLKMISKSCVHRD
jgi:hypothetical protein